MCKKRDDSTAIHNIHAVIDEIIKYQIDSNVVFGDYIAPTIFKKAQCALYFDNDGIPASFLAQPDDEKERKEGVLFLLELSSVLHELEEKHLIFVIPASTYTQDVQLYYEGKHFIKPDQDPEKDIIDENNTALKKSNDRISIVDNTNHELLTGISLPKTSIDTIRYYFSSIILPSNSLVVYKNRGYLSEEQYNTKRALFRSRVANWIAIIIGLFTITMSVVNSCNSKKNRAMEDGITHEIMEDTVRLLDSSAENCTKSVVKSVENTDQTLDSSSNVQAIKSINEMVNDTLTKTIIQ